MQNISSKFNYTIDLGISATKSVFKIKKSKKDKVMNILIIVGIFLMAGLLAWDIIRDASFVIDLIVLIALVIVLIFSFILPKIIIHNQKKFLTQLNLEQMDYTETQITKGKCTESYYKNNKLVMQNVCDITKLIGYEIKDHYVFIVFNNFACAVFDINTLNIPLDEFTKNLDTIINKNQSTTKKR